MRPALCSHDSLHLPQAHSVVHPNLTPPFPCAPGRRLYTEVLEIALTGKNEEGIIYNSVKSKEFDKTLADLSMILCYMASQVFTYWQATIPEDNFHYLFAQESLTNFFNSVSNTPRLVALL